MIAYNSFPRASDCDNLSQLISSEVPFGFLHSQFTLRGDIAGTKNKQKQMIKLKTSSNGHEIAMKACR